MADYQTFSYIMYKEKEHRERQEKEDQKRREEEEKRRQKEAEQQAKESKPTSFRDILRQQQERTAMAKQKRISGNNLEENKYTNTPPAPRISMDELEELFEEEM